MKLFHQVRAALNRPLSLRREPSLKRLVIVCLLGAVFATMATLAAYEGLRPSNEVPPPPELLIRTGTVMPDFTLPSKQEGREVSLAKLRAEGKPVVLLFASLTCTIFQRDMRKLERIYQSYQDRASFLFVYVTEAGHQIDGYDFLLETDDDGKLSLAKRRANVVKATKLARLTIPTVLDIDRQTERAYHAFPLRLVVLDPAGKVALDIGNATQGQWALDRLEHFLNKQAG
jgi:hypothetical protein